MGDNSSTPSSSSSSPSTSSSDIPSSASSVQSALDKANPEQKANTEKVFSNARQHIDGKTMKDVQEITYPKPKQGDPDPGGAARAKLDPNFQENIEAVNNSKNIYRGDEISKELSRENSQQIFGKARQAIDGKTVKDVQEIGSPKPPVGKADPTGAAATRLDPKFREKIEAYQRGRGTTQPVTQTGQPTRMVEEPINMEKKLAPYKDVSSGASSHTVDPKHPKDLDLNLEN